MLHQLPAERSPAQLSHPVCKDFTSCMACLQERVEQLVPRLAELALPEAAKTAQAAARLAMNDLATSTVTEMTALAGVFGKILAQRQGQVSWLTSWSVTVAVSNSPHAPL